MRAPDATRKVKTPSDAAEKLLLRSKIDYENMIDAKLLASGRRVINRPGDRKKDAFIEREIAKSCLDLACADPAVLTDESEVLWSQDFDQARDSIRSVVEGEIERAFQIAGTEAPAICNVHAQTILLSDFQGRQLRDEPIENVTPILVNAHLKALGFEWEDRVRCSVARRIAIVLMNRHMWKQGWIRRFEPNSNEGDIYE